MSGSRLCHLKESLPATRAQAIAASLGKFDLLRVLGESSLVRRQVPPASQVDNRVLATDREVTISHR